MSKLEWLQDSNYNDYALHNGYRIRVEHDQAHGNPFDEEDGNWPISVRLPDRHGDPFKDYADNVSHAIRHPLSRFTDAQLIHWQVHIAKVLDTTVRKAMQSWFDTVGNDGEVVTGYCTDSGLLRDTLNHVFDQDIEDRELFDICVALYKLLDIPAYATQVSGSCQGDWAEVLVVAPPEIVEKFGTVIEKFCMDAKADPAIREYMQRVAEPDIDGWVYDHVSKALLEGTADLYGDWAFGNTWAYVIERPVEVDEDGDVIEWEEIEDGRGGTYFGDDHANSGLEEGALEAVPNEPAVMPEYVDGCASCRDAIETRLLPCDECGAMDDDD